MTRIITDYIYRETLLDTAYSNFYKYFIILSDDLRAEIDYYFASLRGTTNIDAVISRFIHLEYTINDIIKYTNISTLNYDIIICAFDLIIEDIYLEEIEKSIQDN